MNQIFMPYIDGFVIVYLDYILIFHQTWKDYVMHVGKVFSLLKKDKLHVKISKREFGKIYFVYFRYIIGNGQMKIYLAKVEIIMNWPKPNTAT